jgi:hypothetical protein
MVTTDGIDLHSIGMNNKKMGMGFSLRGDSVAFHPQPCNPFPMNRVICMEFTKPHP